MNKTLQIGLLGIAVIIIGCATSPLVPNHLIAKREYEPFDSARITNEQWQRLHESILASHKNERKVVDNNKEIIHVSPNLIYTFTLPNHPAHPAVIIKSEFEKAPDHVGGRKLLTRPYRAVEDICSVPRSGLDRFRIFVIGYFAGDEDTFKGMFIWVLNQNVIYEVTGGCPLPRQ